METDLFNKRMEALVESLHSTPKAKGTERIYYPGEIEWDKYKVAKENGLALPKDVVDALIGLQEESGIVINWKDN